jgi:hypothetical protein
MNFPKTYGLFVVVFTSMVLAPPAWDHARYDEQFVAPSLLADGSGPMPPIPPQSALELIADGSGPMPPIPPQSALELIADGSGPMPPIPPQSAFAVIAI